MTDQFNQCPECNNRYRPTFMTCPQCEVSLQPAKQVTQTIQGNSNQANAINGNNYGTISNESHTTNYLGDNTYVAKYSANVEANYTSFWQLIKKPLWRASIYAFLSYLTYFSGAVSILGWFGINPPDIGINSNWLSLAIFILGLIIILLTARAIFNIIRLFIVKNHRSTPLHNRIYIRNDDNSFSVYSATAKCPIQECAGTLYLGEPPENYERITLCGLCSVHGFRHAFEFNAETLKGARIQITPVIKNQQ